MKTLKSIRLDNDLIAEIDVMAEKEGRSFSNQVERLLMKSAHEFFRMPAPSLPKKVAAPVKRFVPPTELELSSYIHSKGYQIDPVAFLAHYEANGWMRGKNKIKNWKACCTTWSKSPQRADSTTKKASLRDDLTDTSWAG